MTRLRHSLIAVLVAASIAATEAEAARQAPQPTRPRVERAQAVPPAPAVIPDEDATDTRQTLRELLRRYPPGVGRVLRLDPSLLVKQDYLAPYPALAAFLAQHPEVSHNPGYFFAYVEGTDSWEPVDRQSRAIDMWRNMAENFTIFIVFLTVTITLSWLIRTLIDYRRWLRLSKVQAEVHNKLLDRFAANEDLLAYVRTPAGSRFLESAPIALDAGSRAISAPLGRILWSIQAGFVLAAGGIGLQFVSGRVLEEVAQPLYVMGIVALSLGAGFVLSAVVSFALSRRLGLFEPPAAGAAGDRGAPPGP